MDWQAGEPNNSWRYAFMGRVRQSPAHADPAQLASGIGQWNRHMGILDGQLQETGAYACGPAFTLADIVLGLSTHAGWPRPSSGRRCRRWTSTSPG